VMPGQSPNCSCGSGAKYRVTLTNLDGEVLDMTDVCQTCAEYCDLAELVTVPKGGPDD